MKSVVFFNNKGGVGKTSIVYHTAWMLSKLGYRVLAVDLDPKSSLSLMALGEARLNALWSDSLHHRTMYGAVAPLFNGTGDIDPVHIETLSENLGLLVGDVRLASLDEGDGIASQWAKCLAGDKRAIRVASAFGRVIIEAAQRHGADLVLLDLDSGLSSINRAALLAASHVVVPCLLDIFSIQGMENLGPTLRHWRQTWQTVLSGAPSTLGELPQGQMEPIGYIVTHSVTRLDFLGASGASNLKQLSIAYRKSILVALEGQEAAEMLHPDLLGIVKRQSVLMPMALTARKPVFDLTPDDGAVGNDLADVQACREEYKRLCHTIAQRVGCDS